MKPIPFKGQNIVFGENQPEYNPLPALHLADSTGTVITCWEVSPEQIEEIKSSGKIYLSMLTFNRPIMPVSLGTSLADFITINTGD